MAKALIVALMSLWPSIALADCATITLPAMSAWRAVFPTTSNCAILAGASGRWERDRPPTLDPSGDTVACVVHRQAVDPYWVCAERKP
jgi:hypothetical protein